MPVTCGSSLKVHFIQFQLLLEGCSEISIFGLQLLVNDMQPNPIPTPLHLRHQIPNLFDALHLRRRWPPSKHLACLLSKKVLLKKVSKVGVAMSSCHFVDVKQCSIHCLFQFQRGLQSAKGEYFSTHKCQENLDCFQSCSPVVSGWL